MKNKILIVDDQFDIRQLLSGLLSDEGYETLPVESGELALDMIESQQPHVILLDVWLANPRFDGVYFLDLIRKKHPDLPVIMISGHGTIETAVNSLKKGAYDFIEKPFRTEMLLSTIKRAIEYSKLKKELRYVKRDLKTPDDLVGLSSKVSAIRQAIEKTSKSNSRIFIEGEPGVGKQAIAYLIHHKSVRRHGPFCVVSCAQMSLSEFEKKLVGDSEKPGLLEFSTEGTLYFDGIESLSAECQVKLLQLLREGALQSRIIVGAAGNLNALAEKGLFSEDLLFRLKVVSFVVPSLRERCEDIPLIYDYFMQKFSKEAGVKPKRLLQDAMIVLQAYDWPGNIRQLKNMVEWLLIGYADVDEISAQMLPPEMRLSHKGHVSQVFDKEWILSLSLKDAREKFEKVYLTLHMNRFSGNISKTSKSVGMDRTALHRKIKHLGIATVEDTETLG